MQTIWKRFHHAYSSRGSCAALLSVLTILLFAATASSVSGQIVVTQVTAYPAFPTGGVMAGDVGAGGSWGINSSGTIVASTTYGGEIVQFSGPGYAETEAGPYGNAGDIGIDSNNFLYVGGQYGNTIIKVPVSTNGTYTFTVDPSKTNTLPTCDGVVADDTAAGECLVPGPGKLGYLGVGGFAWDAKGNLYFTTDDQAGLYGSSAIPYAIYQCDTACLYGPTFTAPVLIFNEPDSATPKTTGQLFIGAIAFDPWGNLWFTDAAALGTGGNILYSDLNELAYTATSKTFSSTPTVVETLTNSPASNNEIDALVVSTTPSTSNVKSYKIYIGIANSGIFALNDNNGVADPTSLYAVNNLGTNLLAQDGYGNFFAIGYSNANSADSLFYVSLDGPTFPGNPPTTTTANLIVADNSEPCTPTLTTAFSNTDYTAVQGTCGGTILGNGSFVPLTVTLALGTGQTVAPSAGLTVTDTTSGASTTVGAKGPSPISVDQITWGQQFIPAGGSGVYGSDSAGGSSGGVNSKGTLVIGGSYGNSLLEFTAGGTVVTNIGSTKWGGAGATVIDSQNYLYASNEYDNNILKFPMAADGTYPTIPATAALIAKIPACAGDGLAPDTAGICQMTPGGGTTYFGVAALTFDAKGNLFITGDDETSSTATTSGAFSVLECPASCLYGATLTQPVVLWTEPAPDTLGDQLYIGSIAVDASDNVFFTDTDVDVKGNGYNHYGDLYELPVSSGAGYGGVTTGYAAAPTLLETLTPGCGAPPCDYNNELDGVATDAAGDVFFADQYTGIYEILNQSGTLDYANPIPVVAQGAKVIIPDGKGNFYFASYNNTNGGDTIGFASIGSVAFTGSASSTTPVTATISVLDNFSCVSSPVLTFSFSGVSSGKDTDFTVPATAPGCGSMAFGDASSISQTITYTPSAAASGTVTATLTVDDTTNGGSGTATLTALASTAQPITGFSGITSPVAFGGGPYTLSATGGASGNPVVFSLDTTSAAGAATITGTNGATLTITGVGTVVIDINQAGGVVNSVNYSAGYLQVSIVVTQATQTITPPTLPATMVYGTSTTLPAATGGASGEPVVYTIDSSSTSGAGTLTGSTLKATGIGTIVLDLNQLGNANYTAATQVQASITVGQAAQAITISASPTSPTYPTTSAITATGGASGNAVTLAVTSGGTIATLSGTTLTPTGTAFGAVVVTANQLGNTDYSAAAAATVTVTFASEGAVATPTFTPAGGTFYGTATTVAISTTTSGATIWYTTDGSTPGAGTGTSTKYTTPVALATVGVTTVINAIAVETGYTNSAVGSSTYVVSAIPPNFTLALTPPFVIIGKGQSSGTITVSVTPQNPLNTPVTFACSGSASCSFSPASVTTTGTLTSTTTLTVSGGSAAAAVPNNTALFPGATLAVALCLFGFRKRRRLQMIVLLAVSVIGLSLFTGCGGSSSTQPTTALVTVTATSGPVVKTADFTVITEQ
jgi:hypothetical protein